MPVSPLRPHGPLIPRGRLKPTPTKAQTLEHPRGIHVHFDLRPDGRSATLASSASDGPRFRIRGVAGMTSHSPEPAQKATETPLGEPTGDPLADILPELTEEDVAEAMREIPGYLDISPQDFRELYRASATHALARLAGHPMARSLMRVGGPALEPHQYLPEAVRAMAAHRVKSAAVVDRTSKVIGILTETDVLRQLQVSSALGLLARLADEPESIGRCCKGVRVDAVMSTPVHSLRVDATLREMAAAFHRHGGRTMPVVDVSGRLLGILARKDLIHTCGVAGSKG